MIQSTKRTVQIHLGFGSLPDNTFRGVDYASNFATIYDDTNFPRYDVNWHPQQTNVFFYDKKSQPSQNTCVANILKANVGAITPSILYSDVAGYHESGNAMVCVMDP